MRICHVITRLIIGGAQENTLLTCEGLHQRGHDVMLLAGPDTGPEGSLWDRAYAGGYTVQFIPDLRREIRPLCELRALRQLSEAYREFAPEIIHTHSSKAGILGRLAARSFHAAVVHTIHGMSFNRTQSRMRRRLYGLLEREAALDTDLVISVADAMTCQALEAGIAPAEKFVTVYSAMDTSWYEPDPEKRDQVRSSWNVPNGDVVIGTVARLFANKGYEQLIPAMSRLAERDPRARFVWIGDGAHREEYEHTLQRLGLRDRVTFTGLLSPRDVARVLQGLDILVHCSQWEGLPRAVVQALLLEIPVVSFDIDGAPEVVRDGCTGRLVPLNDISALVRALEELADDPAARSALGKAGRELCLTRFDHERMVDRLEALYAGLV